MWTLDFIYHAPDFIHHFSNFIHHFPRFFQLLLCFSWSMFLSIGLFFANLLSGFLAVLCQGLNYLRTIFDVYIYMYVRSDHFAYTCQDFYYLASTLTNTDYLLTLDFYHLANTLTNIDDILKVNPYHLANTLSNTDDKANNLIKKRLLASNQLLTPHTRWHLRLTNSYFDMWTIYR